MLTKAIDELSTEENADSALRWLPRRGAVRVGHDEGFAPIAFKNRAAGFDGLEAGLARTLTAKAGLIIAYEQGSSFADACRSAFKGDIDIDIVVAAARNVERLQELDFVGPFLRVPTVVVSSATSAVDVALDTPGPLRLAAGTGSGPAGSATDRIRQPLASVARRGALDAGAAEPGGKRRQVHAGGWRGGGGELVWRAR